MTTEQEKGGGGKIEKKFKSALHQLNSLLKLDEKKLTANIKVPQSELSPLIEELFKEENEANSKALKEEIKNLIKNYTEFKRQMRAKEQEMKQLEQQKMKEFVEAAKKVFGRIELQGQRNSELESALSDTAEAATSEEEEDKE